MNERDEVGMKMWEALCHAEELGLPIEECTLLAWGTGLNWKPKKEVCSASSSEHTS